MTEQPQDIPKSHLDSKANRRPRSPTMLNLSWVRDRLMKARDARKKIEDGQYDINSEDLAKALLNKKESE